jgi:alkanesulfonate monooxygenase SsuD/methylene tetrahydromethanopterin reductase-like flavin-dependent oxidoreductase (luciferase family)
MKAIWTQEEPEFHGAHVNFDPIWSYPKPVSEGGPPIWIGANSPWVFDRIAEYADGWMPIGGLGSGNMEKLTHALGEKGRDVRDLDLALFGAPTRVDQLKGRIEQGFDHLIFNLPSEERDSILPKLDRYAALAEEMRG